MNEKLFIQFSVNKLRQFYERIQDCFGRLTEEQIWARESDAQNAAGNLALHLAGNVRQWIVSGVGGKPDVRMRDREFAAHGGVTRDELLERLKVNLDAAIEVIEGLTPARLSETIRVQNYDVSVLAAVYHVVEHFAQHTAQIVFLTKLITQGDLGYYRHLSGQTAAGDSIP